MVQFKKSKDSLDDNETATSRGGKKLPVKLEIAEDPLEDQNAPPSKRCKGSSESAPQWGAGANANHVQPSQYNPLDEPSPLGLQLRKSPSLLELIQMRLSQGEAVSTASAQQSDNQSADLKKNKAGPVSGGIEKLKASNFPASILRIGSWEYKSRYEGDLVAKCYFAKHKLVWEVLEGGLKSKIEIQWSDVMALKANCPDTEPGTLTVVLARQPLFFRETNPQPRKHTLWQATADFTNGQASMHRKHFLECPQGLLNKHFEKLIQCDMRLNFLSRQPEIVLDSPYFEQRPSVFEDPDNSFQDLNQVENLRGSSVSSLQDMASPSAAQSSSLEMDRGDHATTSEHMSREAPSPSSVMDARVIEGSGGRSEVVNSKGLRDWDQIRVPGLHPSMSLSDLVNCISEQMTSGNAALGNGTECQDILDDISQYLLSDNQTTTSSDEKKLMARVNSLCCLLKMDPATNQNVQGDGENGQESDDRKAYKSHDSNDKLSSEDNAGAASNGGEDNKLDNISQPSKQVQGMSRKDSFGDLLLHLPRITSLPKFLFNISEDDGESKA